MNVTNRLKELVRPPYVWKMNTLFFKGKELLRLGVDVLSFPNDVTVSQFKKYIVEALNEKWKVMNGEV